MVLIATLLTASLFGAQQAAPTPSPPAAEQVIAPQVDPVAATVDAIAQAMKSDDSVARAYFLRKPSEDGSLIFVLVPIFDKKYPQAAIASAYRAFGERMPPEAKLELFLVPKREYKKYFAQVEPIYVRP
jgi:hypothetical protein